MKKLLFFTSLSLLVAVMMIGCGGKEGSPSNKYGLSTKNSVIWWQLSDVTNLIPYISHDASAPFVYQQIWEPLNQVDFRTLEPIPWTASLPEISDDHLQYTFTLNPAAKWSDGLPITGEDVQFSFKSVFNKFVLDATSLRNYLNSIDSVGYVDGNNMKVRFYLHEPYFLMDRVLGTGYVPIMPKHIFDPEGNMTSISWKDLKSGGGDQAKLKKFSDFITSKEAGREPKYIVGSGPYLFKEWVTFDRITLKKNPNYWAKDMPWGEAYPDEIVYKTINDYNAALTALKAKEVDVMDRMTPALYNQLDIAKQPYLRKDSVYYNRYEYIAWNKERPIFMDKNVRLALSHLINRQKMIDQVLKGLAKPVNSPIIFTQPDYDPNIQDIDYNPDKARQLLKDAGWTDSDGDGVLDKVINGKKTPFKFTFIANSGNDLRKQVLLIVSEDLRKVGIQSEVMQLEFSVYLENLHSHNFDASISGLEGNAGATNDLFQTWHSSQAKNKGSNWHSFINAEADKLLEDTRVEFDREKRKANMWRFQEILHEEQPVSFLWAQPLFIGRVDRFDNVEYFRQRPCFNVQFWITRGAGITPMPGRPSTVKQGS